ncbi:hypothetical protein DFP72DRAFT_1074508 [Ephemerocybe angulata]|uniref:Uncharacterized protein n=1 Tax=Ephemerocybe angulata TaxID=980116 RepID=A0A8H6HKS1_9AGAR|nr:hypothetical protein DFP72DRAFT_1074508 [Tulosesus angulatus]
MITVLDDDDDDGNSDDNEMCGAAADDDDDEGLDVVGDDGERCLDVVGDDELKVLDEITGIGPRKGGKVRKGGGEAAERWVEEGLPGTPLDFGNCVAPWAAAPTKLGSSHDPSHPPSQTLDTTAAEVLPRRVGDAIVHGAQELGREPIEKTCDFANCSIESPHHCPSAFTRRACTDLSFVVAVNLRRRTRSAKPAPSRNPSYAQEHSFYYSTSHQALHTCKVSVFEDGRGWDTCLAAHDDAILKINIYRASLHPSNIQPQSPRPRRSANRDVEPLKPIASVQVYETARRVAGSDIAARTPQPSSSRRINDAL